MGNHPQAHDEYGEMIYTNAIVNEIPLSAQTIRVFTHSIQIQLDTCARRRA
jgi:hypothetical protein